MTNLEQMLQEQSLYANAPLMRSTQLVDAAASTRTPADVLLARLKEQSLLPLWLIILTGRDGESYIPETPLHTMRSERATLDHIAHVTFTDTRVTVLNVVEDGRVMDVSEDMARASARNMKDDGWDCEFIETVRWIGQHLTNDEIWRL